MTKLTVENYMDILKEDYAGKRIQWKRQVCREYKLSEELIELLDEQNKIDWECVSEYQTLSEEFMEKHAEKLRWWRISEFQSLSEEFIIKHIEDIDLWRVLFSQKLSQEFIDTYSDRVDFDIISKYQNLSEEFMEKHSGKVDWLDIAQHQIFSVEFFIKNKERIYKNFLFKNEKLPDSFWKDIRIKIFFSKQGEKVKQKYLNKLKEIECKS